MTPTPSPLLISLPDGLTVSGVATWAVRLAGALASAGRRVTLLLHPEPSHHARLAIPIPPGVEVVRVDAAMRLAVAAGDLSPFIPIYRDTLRRLADRHSGPVVYCPTLLGDAFGLGAALALADPDIIRLVGWQHSDIAYDRRILQHYEPIIARFVGVSAHITSALTAAIPHRAADIRQIPYGVPVPSSPPVRQPLSGRPVRLIYTGRMEHHQKRTAALILLSDELARRRIDHSLTLLGDGPAAAEIDAMIASGPSGRAARIRRLDPLPPDGVSALLDSADAFVLASRYEGLSISMLEALARGCVPIVTRVASGAAEAIEHRISGILADLPADAEHDDRPIAVALADAVQAFLAADPSAMSRRAWQTARDRYSLARHADAVTAVLDQAAASPARPWDPDRPCAFTGGGAASSTNVSHSGSGTVPADAPARLRALLQRLAGRSVILHGAGRHTIELAVPLAESPARIVAITDDDRARWGGTLLGWPIISPADAARTGATDVVISSWLHADAIYVRRAMYERQNLTVHHLYASPAPSTS